MPSAQNLCALFALSMGVSAQPHLMGERMVDQSGAGDFRSCIGEMQRLCSGDVSFSCLSAALAANKITDADCAAYVAAAQAKKTAAFDNVGHHASKGAHDHEHRQRHVRYHHHDRKEGESRDEYRARMRAEKLERRERHHKSHDHNHELKREAHRNRKEEMYRKHQERKHRDRLE